MKKFISAIALLFFILAVTAACTETRQPPINKITENANQICGERTVYQYTTFIPLCNPDDIDALLRSVNTWIEDHRHEYEFIDSNVVNATVIDDGDKGYTMPSGVIIIHIPKER